MNLATLLKKPLVTLPLALLAILFFILGSKYSKEELLAGAQSDLENYHQHYFAGTSTSAFLRENVEERGKLWKAAAKAGIAEGQFLHAECLRLGIPDLPATEKALALYQKASDQGLPTAMVKLGFCHKAGIGTAESPEKAAAWFQKAHDLDFAPAAYWVAHRLLKDEPEGKHQAARAMLLKGFEQNFMRCAYRLGVMYEMGEGVPIDAAKALHWYKQSSQGGCFYASGRLAYHLSVGELVAKDERKSHEYLVRAAEQGDRDSTNTLRQRLAKGYQFVTKNPEKAFYWCHHSAVALGDPDAMSQLGYYYDTGFGTKKDEKLAFRWYENAADRDSTLGLYNLGKCFMDGTGTRKRPSQGVELLQRAADKEFPRALNSLGVIYEKGEHVKRNRAKAQQLWTRAAELGNEEAKMNLAALRKHY